MAATPDEMPVTGELGHPDDCFIEGGTYAFTFSPLWARTMAELVVGRAPSIEIADLSPNRLLVSTENTNSPTPQRVSN